MIVLFGKTASGKSTILDLLAKEGYEKVVTYTTRPKRRGETQGESYNFISEEDFKQKISEGFFAEYDSFSTTEGEWYYGSAKEDYKENGNRKIIILTPRGLESVKELGYEVIGIYIYANNATISKRLKLRGDKKEEAQRRVMRDNIDFKDAVKLADKIVYNNTDSSIGQILDKIKKYIENEG